MAFTKRHEYGTISALSSFLIKHNGKFSHEPLHSCLFKACYSLIFLLGPIMAKCLLGHGGEIVAKLLMTPYVPKPTFLLLLRVCNTVSTFAMQYTWRQLWINQLFVIQKVVIIKRECIVPTMYYIWNENGFLILKLLGRISKQQEISWQFKNALC